MNPNFSSMIDQYKYQQLRIGLVSPKQICAWANKILPNGEIVGEVTKPYTFHYKTNKLEKDRLFCERIFGPIKSGICACGNYQGVEYVDFWIRRYQMGYIKLACPVTHVWYLKRLPSYNMNLLDKPLKELDRLFPITLLGRTYPNFSFARPIAKKPTFLRGSFKYEIQSWKYSIPLFFTTQGFDTFRNREISTGATAIREQLADLDLQIIIDHSLVEWKELGEEGSTGNDWKDRKIGRRKDFLVTNVEPEWMLRPIIQIDGDKLMSSDINEFYRRVIYQNNTLTNLLTTSRSTLGELVMCQEKLVQETVDTLLDNGIHGQPMRDGHNKVYKSFSDVIEGKEGRFCETLLSKWVDYSGRSVIVVGPSLSLRQCGLPGEIAIELFQTFVIRGLIRQHLASNIGLAKSKIREKEPIAWEILQEVVQGHPVLLNRAPPLHRLGIQAFQPILVEGRAICLHPLVCKRFNADFDGDQMAVHVPLSLEAQAEAHLLMFFHTNLLSLAIGDPISVSTQDMLMGLYVLMMGNRRGICVNRYNPCNPKNHQNERIDHSNYKYRKGKEPSFCSSYDALRAYQQKGIDSYSTLWLRWRLDQCVIASINREVPIEVQYESFGTYHEIYDHYRVVRSVKNGMLCIYI
ncbi:unnamed protein product [Victoria cruziana]